MKHAPIVALALMAALVAGCGGGSGTRITDLEDELAAAQDKLDAAQAAQEEARKAEEAAEAARVEAAQEAVAAQEEAREAEEAADAARLEAAQQADAAQAAEQQLRQEQEARQEAESKATELEEEAGHTADQLVQANARQVLMGLGVFLDGTDNGVIGNGDPAVTPRYRESALVDTAPALSSNPDVTFSGITTGTSGKWFRTSLSNRAFEFTDRLDVYSDAESPDSVAFTSVYNEETEEIVARYDPSDDSAQDVVDDGRVVGSVRISVVGTPQDRRDAASSSFPRSGEARKIFAQVELGQFDADRRSDPAYMDDDAAIEDPAITPTYRSFTRYPLRYNYDVGGTLGGASGKFTCANENAPPPMNCRVTNQNNHFRFVGPWVFTPSSASSTVRVNDAEFMYFGWWARQDNSTGDWTYRTFHGPILSGENGNRSTAIEISRLSGTATYRGPAVGQYSFYQPLTSHSEYGEFSARATLRASFDDDMVDGTIDQFSNHPDWTLTLKRRAITNGVIAPSDQGDGDDAVSWQIEDEALSALDSGTWEAAFYSNLTADHRTTDTPDEDAVPTGIAGTFEAEYHHVGRIIGVFGAHKQP